jgi:hypothetical protein
MVANTWGGGGEVRGAIEWMIEFFKSFIQYV